MTQQSRLIPILREGVAVIKLILFKELKTRLAQKHPDLSDKDTNLLSGAVINTLFGTPNKDPQFKAFLKAGQAVIDQELSALPIEFPHLQVPITDALRIQFLCDSLEGINNETGLLQAKEKGILLVNREVPLPKTFISLAKTLGVSYRILSPMSLESRIQ